MLKAEPALDAASQTANENSEKRMPESLSGDPANQKKLTMAFAIIPISTLGSGGHPSTREGRDARYRKYFRHLNRVTANELTNGMEAQSKRRIHEPAEFHDQELTETLAFIRQPGKRRNRDSSSEDEHVRPTRSNIGKERRPVQPHSLPDRLVSRMSPAVLRSVDDVVWSPTAVFVQ